MTLASSKAVRFRPRSCNAKELANHSARKGSASGDRSHRGPLRRRRGGRERGDETRQDDLLTPVVAQLPSGAGWAEGGITRAHGELRLGGDLLLRLGTWRGHSRCPRDQCGNGAAQG